jgi:hypothetical protein
VYDDSEEIPRAFCVVDMASVDTLTFRELINKLSFASRSLIRGVTYEEILDKILRAVFVLAVSRSLSRALFTPNVEIAHV